MNQEQEKALAEFLDHTISAIGHIDEALQSQSHIAVILGGQDYLFELRDDKKRMEAARGRLRL